MSSIQAPAGFMLIMGPSFHSGNECGPVDVPTFSSIPCNLQSGYLPCTAGNGAEGKGLVKFKSLNEPIVAHQAGAYPGFYRMK